MVKFAVLHLLPFPFFSWSALKFTSIESTENIVVRIQEVNKYNKTWKWLRKISMPWFPFTTAKNKWGTLSPKLITLSGTVNFLGIVFKWNGEKKRLFCKHRTRTWLNARGSKSTGEATIWCWQWCNIRSLPGFLVSSSTVHFANNGKWFKPQ